MPRLFHSFMTFARLLKLACPPALAFALAALALGPGCSPNKSAPARSVPNSQPAAPWSWEAFPLVNRMRLGALPCQLQPKSLITVYSPMLGSLHTYIKNPQTNLEAGFLWAEYEPTIFASEAESLEEAKQKLEERERLQMELEIPRQKLQLERQIEEMGRQVALLKLLSTNKELAELTFNVGDASTPLRPESLGKAETELGLLTQTLGYIQATNLAVLGIDLPGQKSEWQRRKLEFERRQSQARLKMPFTGQLTVTLPLTEGVTEYPVNAGQELAVARDLSLVRLRVVLANAAWSSLPPEKMTAVVRLPSGAELDAPFAYQKIERVQQREESVYYFLFPADKASAAARLIGTDVACEIWFALPQAARIVPKLTLVMHNPAAFEGRAWVYGLATTFPGAQLLIEGQTELGIAQPIPVPAPKK